MVVPIWKRTQKLAWCKFSKINFLVKILIIICHKVLQIGLFPYKDLLFINTHISEWSLENSRHRSIFITKYKNKSICIELFFVRTLIRSIVQEIDAHKPNSVELIFMVDNTYAAVLTVKC